MILDDFYFITAEATGNVYRINLPKEHADYELRGIHDPDLFAGVSADNSPNGVKYILWAFSEEENKLVPHTYIGFEFAAYIYYRYSWNRHLEAKMDYLKQERKRYEEVGKTLTSARQAKLKSLIKKKHAIFNKDIKPYYNE